MPSKPFSVTEIKRELKAHAKALSLPSGATDIFIDKSITAATKRLSTKKLITEDDLTRALVKELQKYHTDLAYVYKNRDKII